MQEAQALAALGAFGMPGALGAHGAHGGGSRRRCLVKRLLYRLVYRVIIRYKFRNPILKMNFIQLKNMEFTFSTKLFDSFISFNFIQFNKNWPYPRSHTLCNFGETYEFGEIIKTYKKAGQASQLGRQKILCIIFLYSSAKMCHL